MKLLVIGGGSIGKRHLTNFKQLGVEHLAVVDPREDRRREVADRVGVTAGYPDLDAALRADKFDAVVVGTPTAYHTDAAARCLEHGAHVLMEKPIAMSEDGLAAVLADAKKRKLAFMVGYTYRFWPPLQYVANLLKSQALGPVYHADVTFSEYLPDWHPWEDYRAWFMSKKEQGGGAMLDESHAVDMARWLFGEIRDLSCLTGNASHLEMTADDHAQFMVTYRSGAIGTIHMDLFGRKHRRHLDAVCKHGNIAWDFFQNQVVVDWVDEKRSETIKFSCERNDMFVAESRWFLDCIAGRAEPNVSGEDAIRTLQVLLAGQQSAATGQRVTLA
jgi:predicted dehydrogenase